jgi:hypothetical protein
LDGLTSLDKVALLDVIVKVLTPNSISAVANGIDLESNSLIEDFAHDGTEVVVVEGLKVLLEKGGADGELEICVGSLNLTGSFDVGFVLAVVVQDTTTVLFYGATGDDVVNTVGFHEGEAQLGEGGEAVQTGSRVDIEGEDDSPDGSDCQQQNGCRLHDHLRDLTTDLDLLNALVEVGDGCGETLLLVSDLRTALLKGAEVAGSGGVMGIGLQSHALVLLVEVVEQVARVIHVLADIP